MPRNATTTPDGLRVYHWPGGDTEVHRRYNATSPADLLSVTTIQRLAGMPYSLVAWQLNTLATLATGLRQTTTIGPRGGIRTLYVPDGPFPGEFVRRVLETEGEATKLDEVRKWLRESADEPRDVAAMRGSAVHQLIELGITNDPHPDFIRQTLEGFLQEKRRQVEITDEDIEFVTRSLRQYQSLRKAIPYVLLAAEPQVYNLSAGYAGSADVLVWFLGHFDAAGQFVPSEDADISYWQKRADAGQVTLDDVKATGGFLAVGDWKTSKDVYANHIVQTTAYLAGEFIARDDEIDERLSELLKAALYGLVIHIRPDAWEIYGFPMRRDVLRAFLGAVAYARFLALHPSLDDLIERKIQGAAER